MEHGLDRSSGFARVFFFYTRNSCNLTVQLSTPTCGELTDSSTQLLDHAVLMLQLIA